VQGWRGDTVWAGVQSQKWRARSPSMNMTSPVVMLVPAGNSPGHRGNPVYRQAIFDFG
jgi:hypothetical protein